MGCKDIATEETSDLDRDGYLTLLPSCGREETIPGVLKAEDLQEMSCDVEDLITQQKLFAIQVCKGKQRFADIWFSEGNELLLGHLREGNLPLYAQTIEHSEAMKLVDPSSTLTFLELSKIRSSLGRVYIHLFPDNCRCQQFLSLCTGDKGPSYANTRLLEVGNGKREYIRCGVYENNNGTGGETWFPNIFTEKESANPCGCSAGSVLGEVPGQLETGSQFIICLRDITDHHEKCSFSAFGKVHEGLDVLTHAICQHRNVSEISIQGCGVILSRLRLNQSRTRAMSDASSLDRSF
ncbi:peptidyl-prolyl cis-trans isomerase G-like [Palaemon carinicauda]|uniref:peptidyl-prolyl cis-trans isomerase G-like n=1 Tax=Palaemon carinicauda TaxID=392227 RepID=UPI0035B617FC